MPKQDELCEVVINGQRFREWEAVSVSAAFNQAVRVFSVQITERDGNASSFSGVRRIKTGDKCAVFLAGEKVAEAYIWQRQVALARNAHSILIVGRSNTGNIVDSSAPVKASQYRNYAFQQISEKLLQPFGIKLRLQNPPDYIGKKFKDVNFIPGESVFTVIERLARMRGMFVTDDADGNLVVGRGGKTMQGDIVEGGNLIQLNALIEDHRYSELSVLSQQRGDDQDNMDRSRQPAAVVQGSPDVGHRPLIVASEEPGDATDLKYRAEHDANHYLDERIEVTAVVYGWKSPAGALWKPGEQVMVRSPSVPIAQALSIKTVEFRQDASGTTSSLLLVPPPQLGGLAAPSAQVNPNAGGLPTSEQRSATPQAD